MDNKLCRQPIQTQSIQRMPHLNATQMENTSTQRFFLLKLINNSSSSSKGNHDRDGVWKSDVN